MDESKNKLDKESMPNEPRDSKPLNVDKMDPDTLVELAAISTYFGFSIEKAFNRTLDPAIKKLFNDLSSHLENQ